MFKHFNKASSSNSPDYAAAIAGFTNSLDQRANRTLPAEGVVNALRLKHTIHPVEGYDIYKTLRAEFITICNIDLRAPGLLKSAQGQNFLARLKNQLNCNESPIVEFRQMKAAAKATVKATQLEAQTIITKATADAQSVQMNAQAESQKTVDNAQTKADAIVAKSDEVLHKAKADAQAIFQPAQAEASAIIETAKVEAHTTLQNAERILDKARDQAIIEKVNPLEADDFPIHIGNQEIICSRTDMSRFDGYLSVLASGRWDPAQQVSIPQSKADKFNLVLKFHQGVKPSTEQLDLAIQAADFFSCEELKAYCTVKKELHTLADELINIIQEASVLFLPSTDFPINGINSSATPDLTLHFMEVCKNKINAAFTHLKPNTLATLAKNDVLADQFLNTFESLAEARSHQYKNIEYSNYNLRSVRKGGDCGKATSNKVYIKILDRHIALLERKAAKIGQLNIF